LFAATERSSSAALADSHKASAEMRRHGEINVTKTKAIEPKNIVGENGNFSLAETTGLQSLIYL